MQCINRKVNKIEYIYHLKEHFKFGGPTCKKLIVCLYCKNYHNTITDLQNIVGKDIVEEIKGIPPSCIMCANKIKNELFVICESETCRMHVSCLCKCIDSPKINSCLCGFSINNAKETLKKMICFCCRSNQTIYCTLSCEHFFCTSCCQVLLNNSAISANQPNQVTLAYCQFCNKAQQISKYLQVKVCSWYLFELLWHII